ncbi:MAG: potassium channel protein [Actinomycetia bacterium]|nr:potassium channel protein [Actinomycetes bacterium]
MARIGLGAALVALVLGLGTVGFHGLYGVSWALAFYWALSVVTTVGDARLVPRTPTEILFTAGVLAFGAAGWIYWMSVVVAHFLAVDTGVRRERRMLDRLARLSGHYVVVGAGRVGQGILQELQEAGQTVAIVDRDPDRVRAVREAYPQAFALQVDTFDAEAARKVNVEKARGLALALPDDAQNLYAYLTAKRVNPTILTVARAQTLDSAAHLRQVGVDRIVLPDLAGGRRLGRILLKPAAHDLLMALVNEEGVTVHEMELGPDHPLAHRPVRDLRTLLGDGMLLVGFWRDGRIRVAPPADEVLRPEDCLILVEAGPSEDTAP